MGMREVSHHAPEVAGGSTLSAEAEEEIEAARLKRLVRGAPTVGRGRRQ
jgi:hypothetical protein